eukprot:3371294-Prymnesium_polylepis.1
MRSTGNIQLDGGSRSKINLRPKRGADCRVRSYPLRRPQPCRDPYAASLCLCVTRCILPYGGAQ